MKMNKNLIFIRFIWTQNLVKILLRSATVELLLETDVRLDLAGFDMNHKHSFPVILECSNMEPSQDLEHLSTGNKTINHRLCTSFSTVKDYFN